jgi:hypothetical protein
MKQLWKVSGIVQVEETTTSSTPRAHALRSVEVRVSASRLEDRVFVPWGTTATDQSGRFSFQLEKSRAARSIRVSVKLKNDNLTVRSPAADGVLDDWHTVFETPSKVDGPEISAGTRVFRKGAPGELGDADNVSRAAIWYMADEVQRFLRKSEARFGHIGFEHPISVVYPAVLTGAVTGSSYANGVNRTAYIVKGQESANVVVHELMHLWNYQHNKGTSNWAAAVCFDGDTHGFQEHAAIAFHEGFAEWAKNELMRSIWGAPARLPLSRAGLARLDLNDLTTLERNDNGVTSALHLLTTENIFGLELGAATDASFGNQARRVDRAGLSCPEPPRVSFLDVLKVFLPSSHAEWPTAWEVGDRDYGLVRFYQRASDVLPLELGFSKTMKALYLQLLDVSSTVEPTAGCS